jgi:hypothetical protein
LTPVMEMVCPNAGKARRLTVAVRIRINFFM